MSSNPSKETKGHVAHSSATGKKRRKPPRMKKKTKAILDKIIDNDEISQTDAYIEVMEIEANTPEARKQAGDNASRLINRPSSQLYLDSHVETAKITSLEVLENARSHPNDKNWQKLAADQAERIMDRALGKAVQTSETRSLNINANIERNEELAQTFTEFMKRNTAQAN